MSDQVFLKDYEDIFLHNHVDWKIILNKTKNTN